MSALQHIVAEMASPICNDTALRRIFPLHHTGAMADDDPNGGPNHLRAWREYREMSQVELATAAETTHQVIGYLERGRTQLSAKWLRKLAPLLKTTPGMLLDHDPHTLTDDMIAMWSCASDREKVQLTDIARTIIRTGTTD